MVNECEICRSSIYTRNNRVVICKACNRSYHQNCESLSSVDLDFYTDHKLPYKCRTCTRKVRHRRSQSLGDDESVVGHNLSLAPSSDDILPESNVDDCSHLQSDVSIHSGLPASSTHSTVPRKSSVTIPTEDNFEKLFQILSGISADISAIKADQATIKGELMACNRKLQEHEEILTQHNKQFVQCNSLATQVSDIGSALRETTINLEELNDRVSKLQSAPASPVSNMGITVDKIRRSYNIIIKGIPEEEGGDGNIARTILTLVHENCLPNIIDISRVGSVLDNSRRPRPIRVVFNNFLDPKHILRNKARLATSQYSRISISDDKSHEELKLLQELRKELDSRRSRGEKNITIKYLHGVPSIVSTQAKN